MCHSWSCWRQGQRSYQGFCCFWLTDSLKGKPGASVYAPKKLKVVFVKVCRPMKHQDSDASVKAMDCWCLIGLALAAELFESGLTFAKCWDSRSLVCLFHRLNRIFHLLWCGRGGVWVDNGEWVLNLCELSRLIHSVHTPPDGFEPSTDCLEGSCSIQLS